MKWFPERAITTAGGKKIVQTPHVVGSLVGEPAVLARVDSEALYRRGLRLLSSQKGRETNQEALDCFRQAAPTSGPAAYWLAMMHRLGYDVAPIDRAESVKWFQRSAELDYPLAQAELWNLYRSSTGGVTENKEQSEKWLAKALPRLLPMAEAGDATAAFYLLGIVNAGTKTGERGFNDWREIMEKDDFFFVLGWLGCNLEFGFGFKPKTGGNAAIERAAENGDARAQYHLGFLNVSYDRDTLETARTRNDDIAFRWFKRSAEQGFIAHSFSAQYELGQMYEQGKGVKKDRAKAIEWYRKAARLGHEEARNALLRLNEQP